MTKPGGHAHTGNSNQAAARKEAEPYLQSRAQPAAPRHHPHSALTGRSRTEYVSPPPNQSTCLPRGSLRGAALQPPAGDGAPAARRAIRADRHGGQGLSRSRSLVLFPSPPRTAFSAEAGSVAIGRAGNLLRSHWLPASADWAAERSRRAARRSWEGATCGPWRYPRVSGAGLAAGRGGRVGAGTALSAGDGWWGHVEGRHRACGSGRWGARWRCVGPCVCTGRAPMDLLPDPAPLATRLKNTLLRYHSIADSEWRFARKTVSDAAAPPVSASRCRSCRCVTVVLWHSV